ncbi:MAG: hypothetical protein HUJ83_11475, partial [Veillonella sp.]|nr:hypothetical protein [Veillonella sp.]
VPGSNFVTAGPQMVDFVLRDPPGSNSYATIEAGSTISATHSSSTTGNGTESDYVEISLGPENTTVTGAAEFVCYTVVDINMTDIGLTMSWDVEDLDTWTVSYSFDRAISTSSSPDYVGADGDIFIGSSTNLNVAEAKKLGFVLASPSDQGTIVSDNNVNYKLDISDCLSAGMSYETAFAYTQKHIRESLIPMIYDLRKQLIPNENIVNDFNGLPENKTNKPKYYALPTTDFSKAEWNEGIDYKVCFNDVYNQSDTIATYSSWIENWEKVLADNEAVKVYCLDSLKSKKTYTYNVKDKGDDFSIDGVRTVTAEYGYLGNKSFDAGAIIDESVEISSEHEESYNSHLEAGATFSLHVGGKVNYVGVTNITDISNSVGGTNTDGSTVSSTRKMSYHLEDQDAGDYFSVDV